MDEAQKPEDTSPPKSDLGVLDPLHAKLDQDRREKIEKIKKSLADGTYRISNEEVARKVIEHMREPESRELTPRDPKSRQPKSNEPGS